MSKKKLPTGVRVLLGFLSVVLCLLLFVSTLAAIIVADVRLVTSKDGLQTIITQALFPSSAPARLPAAGLAVGVPGRLAEAGTTNEVQDAVVDAVYGMLQDQFGDELPISLEQVETFLKDSTVPEFLTEKVAGVFNDIYTGNSTTTITKEEVAQLLEENADLIEENLGVSISPSDIEAIGSWVEQSNVMDTVQQQVSQITGIPASDNNDTAGSSGTSDESNTGSGTGLTKNDRNILMNTFKGEVTAESIPVLLKLVRTVTSVTALLLCIGACLLLIGLLFLTHWGRPFAAVRSAGIPVIIAGIFMSVPGALAIATPSLFTGTAMVIVRQILSLTSYVSIGVAVLGLAMIIVGAILNSRMKKKAAKAAEEAPAGSAPAEEAAEEAAPAEEAPAEAAAEEPAETPVEQ